MVVTVKSDTNSVLVKSVSTETFPSTVGTNPQGVRTTNRIIQRVG